MACPMQLKNRLNSGTEASDQKLKSCSTMGSRITLPSMMASMGWKLYVENGVVTTERWCGRWKRRSGLVCSKRWLIQKCTSFQATSTRISSRICCQPASGSSRAHPSCSRPHGKIMPVPNSRMDRPDWTNSRRSWPGASGRGSSLRPMPIAGRSVCVSSQVAAPKTR
ncbi:hypothetical protein FQZ97_1016500 [compost metagenome]